MVTPTAVTPGLADRWSRTARLKESVAAVLDIAGAAISREPTRTWSGRKPGSTARIFWKLRMNAPEVVTSTRAIAISATTRADRSRA